MVTGKAPGDGDGEFAGLLDQYNFLVAIYGDPDEITQEGLKEHLERAHALYIKGGTNSREGTIVALRAVIDFISTNSEFQLGLMDRLLLPLERLVLALKDLSEGVEQEVLHRRKRRSGGPKLTRDEAEFRLLCATAASYLQSTLGEQRALDNVVKRLKKLGFVQKRKDSGSNTRAITANTLRNWQRSTADFKQLVLSNPPASLEKWLFRLLLPLVGAPGALPPKSEHGTPDDTLASLILDQVLPLLFGHLRSREE